MRNNPNNLNKLMEPTVMAVRRKVESACNKLQLPAVPLPTCEQVTAAVQKCREAQLEKSTANVLSVQEILAAEKTIEDFRKLYNLSTTGIWRTGLKTANMSTVNVHSPLGSGENLMPARSTTVNVGRARDNNNAVGPLSIAKVSPTDNIVRPTSDSQQNKLNNNKRKLPTATTTVFASNFPKKKKPNTVPLREITENSQATISTVANNAFTVNANNFFTAAQQQLLKKIEENGFNKSAHFYEAMENFKKKPFLLNLFLHDKAINYFKNLKNNTKNKTQDFCKLVCLMSIHDFYTLEVVNWIIDIFNKENSPLLSFVDCIFSRKLNERYKAIFETYLCSKNRLTLETLLGRIIVMKEDIVLRINLSCFQLYFYGTGTINKIFNDHFTIQEIYSLNEENNINAIETVVDAMCLNCRITIADKALIEIYPEIQDLLEKIFSGVLTEAIFELKRALWQCQNVFKSEKNIGSLRKLFSNINTVSANELFFHLQNEDIKNALVSGEIRLDILAFINSNALLHAINASITMQDKNTYFKTFQELVVDKYKAFYNESCCFSPRSLSQQHSDAFYRTSKYVVAELTTLQNIHQLSTKDNAAKVSQDQRSLFSTPRSPIFMPLPPTRDEPTANLHDENQDAELHVLTRNG